MRQTVVGILAHVDAGKTTLAEAMLFDAGTIRTRGRVDRGDSHLDTDRMERDRGITIFSSQATLEHADTAITLVDSPGHVDFSAEAERTLAALDLAVLVVGANDGIQGHTRTLWRLLERHGIPTIIFANKIDLLPDAGSPAERDALLATLRARLSEGCLPIEELTGEAAAMTDEAALEEFLEAGTLDDATARRLFAERHVLPCLFGSALKNEGVTELLDTIAELAPAHTWPDEFAARVYRVSRGERGERITWLKITGGELRARQQVNGVTDGTPWSEKINELRIYTGSRFDPTSHVSAGGVCAVTGLSRVRPGDVLGAEPAPERPTLAPVLTYGVLTGGADIHTVLSALRELAEEDPMLAVSWDEHLQEIRLRLMGAVQLEVVRNLMARRFGLDIDFGPGSILYEETTSRPVIGVGHFEPLRHYAEVHLRLDPAPRGSGVTFGSECSEDDLDRNWQRLILTNAQERELVGVLTGAPVTDVRITLVGGRAHLKHTEGGDFRQATYRAMRQALMTAREREECVLLEPWYAFELDLPADKIGRAMSDLTRMSARFGSPEQMGDEARLAGEVPVSELGDYALQLAEYTSGQGRISLEFSGYEPCHDADRVIAEAGYDPEADLPNTPDSVFCSHGAGYTVKWHDVPEHAHVEVDPSRLRPWRSAEEVMGEAGR
ncbi:TetM/TetW/TetO/TetS family tetracycline resistance ribosomal protection protein [uncultured Parolsenella sp.]|uniref:elongation factor G n=1 Tax=uncultured Parolsenella sp. TaxID=2083008 RepID=UPI0025F026EC|nr:TetM/TetW/TetO/TetS family tetracycline resistance ribosomal protection protein [uncultured Parolsenella sp.]